MKISNAKRFLSTLLAVIMLLSSIAVSAYAVDLSGYTAISDKYEFAAIADNPNGKYYLTDDIIFTEGDFRSGGAFFNKGKFIKSMDVFKGTFDGCGHSIIGLKADYAIARENQGIIKNLCLEDSAFQAYDHYGDPYEINSVFYKNSNEITNCKFINIDADFLISFNGANINYCFGYDCNYNSMVFENKSDISYCINNSDINATINDYIGGIACHNSGTIQYCINTGDITANAHGTGGICGSDGTNYDKGIITYCANYGNINAPYSAGICCQCNEIENCINYGDIVNSAGIICAGTALCCINLGKVESGSEIIGQSSYSATACYSSSDIPDISLESSYPLLNFDDDWQISDGKPILQMENERIIGASIYSLPQKMTYKIGEAFDKTGLFVRTFDNKGNWETTNSYSVSGYTGKFGYNTVKVKCNGFENSFTVAVTDSIENCTVYPIDPVTATGKAIEIVPKIVSSRGTSLKYGTDFTLDFENNTKPGIATVHIIGKGLYYGLAETIFEIKNNISFPDVSKNAWYYDSVIYCANNGFISGYQNGNFGPNDKLKRQDFVCILARIAGADLTKYSKQTSKLNDVKKGAYYAAAVNWAVDNGIIAGYANGNFGVNDPITREQVATILYRYMGSPSVSGANSTLSKFKDVNRISSFAKTPVAWAVQEGIISGMADSRVAPTEGASRAQIASIIMRMDSQGMFD